MGKGARQRGAGIRAAKFRCARCNGALDLVEVAWDWGGAQVTLAPCPGCKDILTTAEVRRAARDAGSDELLSALRRMPTQGEVNEQKGDEIEEEERTHGEQREVVSEDSAE